MGQLCWPASTSEENPMTYRELALRIAQGEIGVRENPPGSNSGPKVNQYLKAAGLGPGYPWCMAFLVWTFGKAGLKLEYPNKASVGFFEDWARRNGHIVYDPKPGDVVCYRYDGDDWPDHVGIVLSVQGRGLTVVEGNTSYGNDSDGGRVMLRTRQINRCTFVRVPGDVPDATVRVDVEVDGRTRNTNQKVTNPAFLKRLHRFLKTGKRIVVSRSKDR